MPMRTTALSLFSGAGIGDVGLRAAGLDFISLCEVAPDRAALARLNFPEAGVFSQGVAEAHAEIVNHARGRLAGDALFLLSCTAPCQGMSRGGRGAILKGVRDGRRPARDPRNRLVLHAIDIARELRPLWVIFENVVEMRQTSIEVEGQGQGPRLILDVIADRLGPEYDGRAHDVEVADYGVPQRRKRLITVLTRDRTAIEAFRSGQSLVPPATHAKKATQSLLPWVSVADAIRGLPPLDGEDAASASNREVPYHRVPVLSPNKYEWVRHAAPGKSAFDNQCVQPGCGFQGNRRHGAAPDASGTNRARRDTPLYCEQCGTILPRPHVVTEDGPRLMSAFPSAYKRMDATLPAPTLTKNLSYACSDQKLHPTQNRVLSLAEAMRVHSLDRYAFDWGRATDALVRTTLGESVPPYFFELLGRHLVSFPQPPESP